MNLVYVLTCVSVIAVCINHLYVSRQNRLRAQSLMGIVDQLLPRLMPQLQEPAQQTGAVSMEGIMADDASIKFQEHTLREEVHSLAMAILEAHAYSKSYPMAYKEASEIVQSRYHFHDQPLSPNLQKILGEPVPQGKPVAQAAQSTMH